ncbi:flagellar protein FliS [Pseudomonas citronellolis]|uniref:Flagellar secretion chaperone FliS n=1 Tax=Pseudomonas citronellolis TaxID=53408 RepID=A0AAQ1HI89_9PSED|nr:flagellar export chaperone FliS [Pseudomonas citronellolis]MDN6870829.1 flagellar export chaperone FliS [Pseudomonas citronellolis]TGC29161.1 flagella export chaperone FliS [Pseudomonas citronellolis]UUC53391.1 flagellar export chaperone FliS [Pseudomonas citronellolis]SFB84128.1 flagellar protein FliS [Pseudomonas citronellolis]
MNAMAALRQYQNVGVQAQLHEASPHRLIQMLMEGGLSRIAQARGAMQRGQMAEKGQLIGKAVAIVGGLRDGLNLEAGGDYAERLNALYIYMGRRLLEANRQNDEHMLDEVANLLRSIKEGWDGIPQ